MPRYNVQHEGKWACFSSISDDFVTGFMDKESYEKWRKAEYGLHDCEPAEKCNTETMHRVLMITGIHLGVDRVKEIIEEADFDNFPMQFYETAIAKAIKDLDETGGCSYPDDPFE